MFFTDEKLEKRIVELFNFRYSRRQALTNLTVVEDVTKVEKYPPKEVQGEKLKAGDQIIGRDRYFWLQGEIEVPEDNTGDFLLLFNFGKSVPGNTSGFESLCFVNGELYQGVDGNHNEIFIDKKYNGTTINLDLRLWTGLEGGGAHQNIIHTVRYMDSAYLNEAIDDLIYTSQNIFETTKLLNENDPLRFQLINLLNDAFLKISWPTYESDFEEKTFDEARNHLNSELEKMGKDTPVNVTAIGHTHIDVAWLWRLKHTREKAARSFSTVLKLMDQYPEYIFLQTQPQVYEYIKEDYPELYAEIKKKVAEGRWEIEGAMWLESDANLPSGESLVRQLLVGSQFIKKEFNKDTEYLWLPDVFGYSWALPQILKKSGIDVFMTTKISWNQFNRMPNDTFIWKGIDGSEVLTHFITTPDPNNSQGPFFYTYNGLIEPYTVKGIYDGYRDKHINSDLLLAYGYGDGGGGVNRDMLENIRRIDKIPGLPNIKTGTAGGFFKKLKQTFDETPYYKHVWDGELYLEYHRGTYTSQAKTKKWNRFLELKYKYTEFLSVVRLLEKEVNYPSEELLNGWKIILRNQFHDIIPGSSIKEVYEDSEIEYNEADAIANAIIADSNGDNTVSMLVNTTNWQRNSLVDVTDFIPDSWDSVQVGEEIYPLTYSENRKYFVIQDFKGLNLMELTKGDLENKKDDSKPFTFNKDGYVETPYYTIRYNEKGWLTSVYDKEYQREVLLADEFSNQFLLYEDKPLNWEAWDIDIFHTEKVEALEAKQIEIAEVNDLFIKIKFSFEFNLSKIIQYMVLYNHTRRIDFETKVDWQERQKLLRTSFKVDIRTTAARYDIQYGNVTRPNHWNTSWDYARFESVGHQWADLSQTDYGVSLMNDSKYGYSIKGNHMQLSLLKGPIYPDPDADKGEHTFTYSLYPHKGDYIEGNVIPEAYDLNDPIKLEKLDASLSGQLLDVKSSGLVTIDSIKLSESGDGVIVRLHESVGASQTIELKPNFAFKAWQATNLLEVEIGEPLVDEVKFKLAPFEIYTLKFKL